MNTVRTETGVDMMRGYSAVQESDLIWGGGTVDEGVHLMGRGREPA